MSRITESVIALTIARRSVKRNKLQSFLIIAIIAIPVFLVSALLTLDASTKSTGSEKLKYELGDAVAKYAVQYSPSENLAQNPGELQLQEIIPDGTAVVDELVDIHQILPNTVLISITRTEGLFKTAAGVGPVSVFLGESWNAALLNKGPVTLLEGSIPKFSNEVLVTPSALERFGVQIGEQISTENGDRFKVVGTMRDHSTSSSADVVFAMENAIPSANGIGTYYYQVSGESPSWNEVIKLNKQGVAVLSRSVLLNPPTAEEQLLEGNLGGAPLFAIFSVLLFLVPLGLLPVVVLAGSAFAFGARRQTKTLAVMSSLGASRNTLQNVTVTSGIWLGFLGGLIGVVLGLLLVASFGPTLVTRSFTVQPTWDQYPGFHVPWTLLIILVFASGVLGAISSYLPARRASRVNILATLRGQRSEGQVRARTGVGALVLLLVGLAVVFLSSMLLTFALNMPKVAVSDYENAALLQRFAVYGQLAGGIITVIGFMVGRGWILRGIRAVISRFGKQFNFAGRDLLFNRSRYAPVLSSVLVVYFVGAMILSVSYGPMQKQAIENAKQQTLLPGQYNYEFPLDNDGAEPTIEEHLASIPSMQTAEFTKNLITQTGAFTNAAVITATLDFYHAAASFDSEGNFLESSNFTMPHVIFNPDTVCYYQSISSHNESFMKEHQNDENYENYMSYPPGCLNVMEVNRTIVVADVKTLQTISNRVDQKAEQVLTAGGVVLFSRLFDFDGTAKIRWTKESEYSRDNNFDSSKASKAVDLKSYVVPGVVSESLRYVAIISPETAAKLEITAYPVAVLANTETPISTEVTDELFGKGIWFERFVADDPNGLAWLVTWVAGIFVLLSTSIALGLSQIEAATDKRTLAAIGAPKSFRARMVATQAFALTFTGSLLGGGVGIAVGLTLVTSASLSDLVLPWTQVVTLLVFVPMLAAFIFWFFTPRKLKYEVRQALD